jgi:hypothetical protein
MPFPSGIPGVNEPFLPLSPAGRRPPSGRLTAGRASPTVLEAGPPEGIRPRFRCLILGVLGCLGCLGFDGPSLRR